MNKNLASWCLLCGILLGLLAACSESKEIQWLEQMHLEYVAPKHTPTHDSLAIYIAPSPMMPQALKASKALTDNLLPNLEEAQNTFFSYKDQALISIALPELSASLQDSAALSAPLAVSSLLKAAMNTQKKSMILMSHAEMAAEATGLVANWVAQGNVIHALSYQYATQPYRYLYCLFFVPKAFIKPIDLVVENMRSLAEQQENDFHYFVFQNLARFPLFPSGYDLNNGGLNEYLVATNYTQRSHAQFEFYELSYTDISKSIWNNKNANDKRLFRKIKLITPTDGYATIAYTLQVYDLSNIFELYQAYKKQKPVEYTIDKETGDTTIVDGQQMVFTYQEGRKLKEGFEASFEAESQEVGVAMLPDFKGSGKPMEYYRIEIALKSAKWNPNYRFPEGSLLPALFQATQRGYAQGKKNPALYTIYLKINY